MPGGFPSAEFTNDLQHGPRTSPLQLLKAPIPKPLEAPKNPGGLGGRRPPRPPSGLESSRPSVAVGHGPKFFAEALRAVLRPAGKALRQCCRAASTAKVASWFGDSVRSGTRQRLECLRGASRPSLKCSHMQQLALPRVSSDNMH